MTTEAKASTRAATAECSVPASHLDLLQRPICGVFSTIGVDGWPQSSLVWVDFDGTYACVNTTLERQKGQNLQGDTRVSLLVVDPANSSRFLQIRGDAELVSNGADEHIDRLARRYTPFPGFYGYLCPVELRTLETRVVCRVHPRRVTVDAIHA